MRAIQKIPISVTNAGDNIIWSHTKNGNYTVKSGYAQAFKAKLRTKSYRPSSSRCFPNKFWVKLWTIPSIPKVLNFVWRVIKNWTACKDNLCRRKCSQSPTCPICEQEQETMEHVLFRCSWTEAVWFGCVLSYWIKEQPIVSVDKWVEDLLCGDLAKVTNQEQVGFIFQVCWAIWKTRNDYVFNGVLPNPERTVDRAKLANSDYLMAVYNGPRKIPEKVNREKKWIPPPPSSIKFNCDGAFSSSRSSAAFGCLARDSGGGIQCYRAGRIVASSALATEAWALRIACGMAVDLNLSSAVFESDCKELVDCINNKINRPPWEIKAMVEDIKQWAQQRNWKISWVCREQNAAAHWLATHALDRSFICNPNCIPTGLSRLLMKDRLS